MSEQDAFDARLLRKIIGESHYLSLRERYGLIIDSNYTLTPEEALRVQTIAREEGHDDA